TVVMSLSPLESSSATSANDFPTLSADVKMITASGQIGARLASGLRIATRVCTHAAAITTAAGQYAVNAHRRVMRASFPQDPLLRPVHPELGVEDRDVDA